MKTTSSPASPPAAPAPVPPLNPCTAARPPDRARWTPAKQRIFLSCLLETGSVARAARAAGMSRSSAHRLRQRLAGTPFDHAWEHALIHHERRLVDPFGAIAQAAPDRRAGVHGRAPSVAQPERR